MASHPNRGRTRTAYSNPLPDQVIAARGALTQSEAAALVYSTASKWQKWEVGEDRMHPGLWELFNRKRYTAGRSQESLRNAIEGAIFLAVESEQEDGPNAYKIETERCIQHAMLLVDEILGLRGDFVLPSPVNS